MLCLTPYCGISTTRSHTSRTSGATPRTSLPSTKAQRSPWVGFHSCKADAVWRLLDRGDLPILGLKVLHCRQGFRMSAPWNVATGAEGALQNVPMRGMTRDAAKVQSIDAKRVRGPEAGTDVLATSDVVQNKADRQPFRLSKRFSREALSEALSRHYLMRRL